MSDSHDDARVLGPASAFQIEGRLLRFGPHDGEVAVYQDGRWHCQGTSFTVLECAEPSVVCFEDDSAWRPSVHGPFAALQIANGTIRHGADFEKVLARFDEEAACWIVDADGEAYSTVVLARPPRPLSRARRQTPTLRTVSQPLVCGSTMISLARGPDSPSGDSMEGNACCA